MQRKIYLFVCWLVITLSAAAFADPGKDEQLQGDSPELPSETLHQPQVRRQNTLWHQKQLEKRAERRKLREERQEGRGE